MTIHGDQNANKEAVTRRHLFDELADGTGGTECNLPTNYYPGRAIGAGQINVQTWPMRGHSERHLDGFEEAKQA
ncbi:MAG: hypothetical protein OXH76_24405 [Boseongicola sp.]|nr:hypothetical protein [Boseongicola sp.]MYH57972.1 hypothetical protein [Boseongicola sp. SB0675_bin_26]